MARKIHSMLRAAAFGAAGVLATLCVAGTATAQTGADVSPLPATSPAPTVSILTFAEKCLDVWGASSADSTPIIQYRCHGGANQHFRVRGVGYGEVEIRTFAGKCLDVRGASSADSTPTIQYRCHGGANQHFRSS
ncbi:RICIN domain-containing protein [Actinophytocola sp.]|uniref:RICIN domain-containing protein n=1 Tax=Actinophytocola sp. TaxID=1872138 RepID=UPI002D6A20A1|nr:RICIN domain-containing protein [Actinophytocola sp.]HYQ66181.1 RICIN domain-containing protein [Actinophytocola sp.]